MRQVTSAVFAVVVAGLTFAGTAPAQQADAPEPTRVYVPYEQLTDVLAGKDQGVFLPYEQFEKLWRAAKGRPAEPTGPADYLVSTARITGRIDGELARLSLELTVDVLTDEWVEVPLGLGDAAVARGEVADADGNRSPALLRVTDKQHVLVTRGKGRRTVQIDLVRKLQTEPGINVLQLAVPPAAIGTLELLIPQDNMNVDVEPMLAASTRQVDDDGAKATRLRAFLGGARQVALRWKPKTQASEQLDPIVTSRQLQHIHVAEAVVSHDVTFQYTIERRGVDTFHIRLPEGFRVTGVDGANLRSWDIAEAGGDRPTTLTASLFSPAKGEYTLTVRMEKFLADAQGRLELSPISTVEAIRSAGHIAVTRVSRRSTELRDLRALARVDTRELPGTFTGHAGLVAYRFISADYGATLAIGTVLPRISARQGWSLAVDSDRMELAGRLNYTIERAGLFQLTLDLPEPWEVVGVGPEAVVEDYELTGEGDSRRLRIMLRREATGHLQLTLHARADRTGPEQPIRFVLPTPPSENLRSYHGQLALYLAEQLRAEVTATDQLQPLPLSRLAGDLIPPPPELTATARAMAFESLAVSPEAPSTVDLSLAVKPPQVSAVVHRIARIEPGSVEQQAIVEYRVRYAPVDTFYLKMPAALAGDARIQGPQIKETPRIEALPPDQQSADGPGDPGERRWAYFKIVLQSPVTGTYRLSVETRESFGATQAGDTATVEVQPILAAGTIAAQSGHIALAKTSTLSIGQPIAEGLTAVDPGSGDDMPYAPHRRDAVLAFRYSAPPFALSVPVTVQQEAAVFTTIAKAAVIEQVLATDGTLNTHATFLLATSRGDRLSIRLPDNADLFAVLVNGAEEPVEPGADPRELTVRLRPSAGQVSKIVLEVSYGLEAASAASLPAPRLPDDVPVQQTLWRLWIPAQASVLAYDRSFAAIEPGEFERLMKTVSQGYPRTAELKLAPQGKPLSFVHQGSAAELSISQARQEVFHVILWVLVLAAGSAMLALAGRVRVLIVLAVAAVAGIASLFVPLLIVQAVRAGAGAGLIVLALWIAQAAFRAIRRIDDVPARRPRPATAAPPPPPDADQRGDDDDDGKEA